MKRYTPKRKAEIVEAFMSQKASVEALLQKHDMSREELKSLVEMYNNKGGTPALRATRFQEYKRLQC